MFTIADISLAVLLSRMTLLGMEKCFFSPSSSPYLYNYFKQVQKRKAFKKVNEEIANIRSTVVWENVKAASPYLAGISGTAVTLSLMFWLYKKLR